MHFSNGRFSNKETGFSGPYVVWSLLGAPGEKKRENQMYLQYLRSSAPFFFGDGKTLENPPQDLPNAAAFAAKAARQNQGAEKWKR